MIVEKCPLKPKDSILLQTMSNFGLLGSILDLYNAMKPQKKYHMAMNISKQRNLNVFT